MRHKLRLAQAKAMQDVEFPDMPKGDQVLYAWPRGTRMCAGPCAMIVESARYRGFYHVHALFPTADGFTRVSTERPVWGRPTSAGVSWVWATACMRIGTSDIESAIRNEPNGMAARWEKSAPDGVWNDGLHELAIGLVEVPRPPKIQWDLDLGD